MLVQSYQVTDRAVEDGDTVNIDYVGKVDGEEFDGGSAEGYDLSIGSNTFIDGFEDQIIGHTPDEEFDVNVTFPDDYSTEDLAGKDAVFTIKLNYIAANADVDVDDAFVKENLESLYGFSTVKAMKKDIKERLEDNKKYEYIQQYLLDNSTFKDIPDTLINDRLDVAVDSVKANVSAQGYSMEDYLSNYGYDSEDDLRDAYKDTCEETVKTYLVVDTIAAAENLSVTDDDISEYFGGEDYSSYVSSYSESYIRRVVLNYVVIESIIDSATVK
jgi:trigger factor